VADFQSALEVGLYNKLTTQASLITALGGTLIYNSMAPQNPGTKYAVFQWQGGGDANESPTRMRNLLYTVRGVATTKAVALSIDSAIDDALHNQTLTVSGWTNIQLQRETDINFIEQDAGGVNRYHAGAIYRVIIDS
jgi:hypothetical protein